MQLVSDIVSVRAADKAATPSNVAAVAAGAEVIVPDPLQVGEVMATVKLFVCPFAMRVL